MTSHICDTPLGNLESLVRATKWSCKLINKSVFTWKNKKQNWDHLRLYTKTTQWLVNDPMDQDWPLAVPYRYLTKVSTVTANSDAVVLPTGGHSRHWVTDPPSKTGSKLPFPQSMRKLTQTSPRRRWSEKTEPPEETTLNLKIAQTLAFPRRSIQADLSN